MHERGSKVREGVVSNAFMKILHIMPGLFRLKYGEEMFSQAV